MCDHHVDGKPPGVAEADVVRPIWINVPGARVFGGAIIDFDDY